LRPVVPEAPKILLNNVYGWFVRIGRGVYDLTDAGRAALVRWPQPAPEPRTNSGNLGSAARP
jgi:hypothetical protein